MKIPVESKKLGSFEVDEDRLIFFKEGILGFPDERRYALMENDKRYSFFWLQSVENIELAFVVTDPLLFKPDYQPPIPEGDLQDLEIHDSSALMVLAILSIPQEDPLKLTANLQAPLVINARTRKGKQIVLNDYAYEVREPVLKPSISKIN